MRGEGRDRGGVWRGDDTRGARRVCAATLFALCGWWMGAPAMASADSGGGIYGAGGGPVFAWGEHGFTSGWELSATFATPLLHMSLGGDYLRGDSGLESAHYLALEPGLFLGGSLGAAVSGAGVTPYLGAWAGFALPPDELRSEPIGDGDYSRLSGVLISLAIGLRWFDRDVQFYLTPKINYYEFPNPNS